MTQAYPYSRIPSPYSPFGQPEHVLFELQNGLVFEFQDCSSFRFQHDPLFEGLLFTSQNDLLFEFQDSSVYLISS